MKTTRIMPANLFVAAFALPLTGLTQQTPTCSGTPYELAESLTGTWQEYTVTDDAEVLEGTLRSYFKAGGCAYTQEFTSVDGAFSFVSIGHVDPKTGMWDETFVFSNGRVSNFHWNSDGEDILLSCVSCQTETTWRLRIANISTNYYEAIEEHSPDGGKTWEVAELTRTRRVKP